MQTWKPEKVERIINEKPAQAFYDGEMIKYDVNIQEGVLTDTQRQMYFRQLVDLKQLGAPVTGTMLAQAAPIQGKSEYTQQLEQMEQMQAQQAQQEQQVQQSILQSQLELNKASSIEKVSGAKERFTRAVANMGLEDERASEAIQNRAQGTLDKVKAMKELEAMDDDRLLKYLDIVLRLNQMNENKEEDVKADDVNISEAGRNPAPEIPLNVGGELEQQQPEE
jgi:hypothetical protein